MNAYQEKLLADIQAHGHQVRFIGATDESTSFAYTVGRSLADRPELFVSGNLHPQLAMTLLNDAARWHEEGNLELKHGGETGLLLPNYVVRIVACDPWAAEMSGATTMSDAENKIEAYQLLWPDQRGRFPDNPNYDAGKQPQYPLGVMRIFAELDEERQALATTTLCSDHVHQHNDYTAPEGVTTHVNVSGQKLACRVCGTTA